MKNKILTAEEIQIKYRPEWDPSDRLTKMLIEFAKIHVKAALKAAAENANVRYQYSEKAYTGSYVVNQQSILSVYPLENIK